MQPSPVPAGAAFPSAQPPVPDDASARELDSLPVGTYRSIERFEERPPRTVAGFGLNAGKVHAVDVVERAAGRAHVRLTHEGRRAVGRHAPFHRRMAYAVAGNMEPAERVQLARGIRKLKAFFEKAANGDAHSLPLVQNR